MTQRNLKITDFTVGERVMYIPYHAGEGPTAYNCIDIECGKVSRVDLDAGVVFIEFSPGTTPQACNPDQLDKPELAP